MNFTLMLLSFLLLILAVWLWSTAKAQVTDLFVQATITPRQEIMASNKLHWTDHLFTWTFRTSPFFILAILFGWTEKIPWLSTIGIIGLLIVSVILASAAGVGVAEGPTRPEGIDKQLLYVQYVGYLELPKKVYWGDSYTIMLSFNLAYWDDPNINDRLKIQEESSGKLLVIRIANDNAVDKFLEVELLAAGITVDGEKKPRLPLNQKELPFRWNCHFENSGNYVLTFVFRLVSLTETVELGIIEHRLKAAKVDHLTQRQVWLLAATAGIISGIIAMVKVLKELNLL
jgi:hypothetical protein